MNTIKTKINEVKKEVEVNIIYFNRWGIIPDDLCLTSLNDFDKNVVSFLIKKKELETLKFCQAEMENERARVIKLIDKYRSLRLYRSKSCQLLLKQLKSQIEKEKANETKTNK